MANVTKKKNIRQTARTRRVSIRIRGTQQRPRMAVYRSLKHISVQLIDDTVGKTILAATDKEINEAAKMKKTDVATRVGALVAEKAKQAKIITVVFDRRGNKYHGRVKALADGARAKGLEF